jgi:hypothetical protein
MRHYAGGSKLSSHPNYKGAPRIGTSEGQRRTRNQLVAVIMPMTSMSSPFGRWRVEFSQGPRGSDGERTRTWAFTEAPHTPCGLVGAAGYRGQRLSRTRRSLHIQPKPSPFGVSFTGMACAEPRMIGLAYAFEQATKRRVPPPLNVE